MSIKTVVRESSEKNQGPIITKETIPRNGVIAKEPTTKNNISTGRKSPKSKLQIISQRN